MHMVDVRSLFTTTTVDLFGKSMDVFLLNVIFDSSHQPLQLLLMSHPTLLSTLYQLIPGGSSMLSLTNK